MGRTRADGLDVKQFSAAQRRKVAGKLVAMGVIDNLTSAQSERAVDIVLRFDAHNAFRKGVPADALTNVQLDQRLGGGHRRMFAAKLKKAQSAVHDVLTYARNMGQRNRNPLFARTLTAFAIASLDEARRAIDSIPVWINQFHEPPALTTEGLRLLRNPQAEATSALMEFFVADCKLKKSDAAARTARIGNAFALWHVKFQPVTDGADRPQGSDAIRKRMARRSPRTTRTRRKN
jgi:hypothetical protein